MERFLAVRWSDEDGTQTELLSWDDISFLAVRWSAEDGTVKGRKETGLLPRDYTMSGDKGTLQLRLTTTTKDTITFCIKDISTCKNNRGEYKLVFQWKLANLTYTLYTNNNEFLTDLNLYCNITPVSNLF